MNRRSPHPRRAFLSARWSNLAMLTYAVPADLLRPRLPPGCELDLREGEAFVSLVAFDFLETRVLGIGWPGYRNFPEINLRFYVRHGEERGVCFIREFVPHRLIAGIARRFYNEPYRAAPMRSSVMRTEGEITVGHTMMFGGRAQSLSVTGTAAAVVTGVESVEHFFKEHEWGFGVSRRGRLIRYRISHPIWEAYPVIRYELDWDWEGVYGAPWGFLKQARPCFVILAVGSEVRVFPP
jgi:uncharacterized protein YqjF (DUF2071 family)